MRRATSWTMLPTTCRRFCWAATTCLLAEILWHSPLLNAQGYVMNYAAYNVPPLGWAAATRLLAEIRLHSPFKCAGYVINYAAYYLPPLLLNSYYPVPTYLQKSSDTVPFKMRRATSWTMLPTTCRRCWWAATTCWPASSSSASGASSSLSPFVAASEAARSVTSYTNHICFLQGQPHEICFSMFFQQSSSRRPLIITLESYWEIADWNKRGEINISPRSCPCSRPRNDSAKVSQRD